MKQGVQYTNTTASYTLGRYNNVLKENRLCNCGQRSNIAIVFFNLNTMFFKCVKYNTIRQIYLFNRYIHGTEPRDFYALLR